MGIGFLWAIILGGGILFFTDTPRYLYRRGHTEEAKRIMQRVYGALQITTPYMSSWKRSKPSSAPKPTKKGPSPSGSICSVRPR